MKKNPENVVPLTKPTEDNPDVENPTEETFFDTLNKLDEELRPEIAPGKFQKSNSENIPPEYKKPLPLPTYEMDHLRNALIPIFFDKEKHISDELKGGGKVSFDVGVFHIIIMKSLKGEKV
jgi:hypothetical protein